MSRSHFQPLCVSCIVDSSCTMYSPATILLGQRARHTEQQTPVINIFRTLYDDNPGSQPGHVGRSQCA